MDDQRRLVHSSDEKEEIRKTLNMANGMRVNGDVQTGAPVSRNKRTREVDHEQNVSCFTSSIPSQRQRVTELSINQHWDTQVGAAARLQSAMQLQSSGLDNQRTLNFLAQSSNPGSNASEVQQMKSLLLLAASQQQQQQQQQQQVLLQQQSQQLQQKQLLRQLLGALQQQQLLQSQNNMCLPANDSNVSADFLRNQQRIPAGASEWQEQLARLLQQQQSNSSLLQQKPTGNINTAMLLSTQAMQNLPNSLFGVQPQANAAQFMLQQVLMQQNMPKQAENKDNSTLLQALLSGMGGNANGRSNLQVLTTDPGLQTPLIDAFMRYQQSNLMKSTAASKPSASDEPPANIVRVVHHNTPSESPGMSLSLPTDMNQLSQYQLYIRQNLEFFESRQEDVETNVQGRKKRVQLGQVGIRCIHCADIPIRQRGRGSTYYPLKLSGVYQAAQNMALTHLSSSCMSIPDDVRGQLDRLRKRRDTAGGGKQYWADSCARLGLYEDEHGIWFEKKKTESPQNA